MAVTFWAYIVYPQEDIKDVPKWVLQPPRKWSISIMVFSWTRKFGSVSSPSIESYLLHSSGLVTMSGSITIGGISIRRRRFIVHGTNLGSGISRWTNFVITTFLVRSSNSTNHRRGNSLCEDTRLIEMHYCCDPYCDRSWTLVLINLSDLRLCKIWK